MKKISYRKILKAGLWLLAVTGLWFSFSFVSKQKKNQMVSGLNIIISNDDENQFINEENIKRYLNEAGDDILSRKVVHLNIPKIEKQLNTHPAIENAEVAADVNGEVLIRVKQRKPVCRIINLDGESYYIDTQDKLMPLSENQTARVLVVSGNITEPYARRYQYSIAQIHANSIFSEVSLLDDILEVVKQINTDSTMSSLIQQVYVNQDKEFELFPSVGGQKIILGSATDLCTKLNKLKLFYTQGLNKSDSWKKYSSINLKFKNLVVCTKK